MRLPQPHPQRISPKGFMHEAQTKNGVPRGPSWKKVLGSSSRPFVDKREVAVAVAVLRGPSRPFVDQKRSCSCRSSRFFAALRGSKKKLQLPFFAVLRGPSWIKKEVAVAVLRGPSRPFVDQKEVAVAVLRGPSRSFAALRGPSWIKKKLQLPFFAVLRGPSWPFVDKKKLPLQLPFSAVLRGPSWIKKKLQLPFSVFLRRQNKLQHTKCHPKGLSKISRSGRISYNYNQCLSLLKPKIREPRKNRAAGPPLA